jgi:hypothetical protein
MVHANPLAPLESASSIKGARSTRSDTNRGHAWHVLPCKTSSSAAPHAREEVQLQLMSELTSRVILESSG